jgi:septal ring factor EnvC (AmiA/AmiB activator)
MMRRYILIFLTLTVVLVGGVFLLRPAAWAQGDGDQGATAEVRRAVAQARGEAARARERAAQLDRQARSALAAGDKATLAAAALAARVQQAEAAFAAADANLTLARAGRRALGVRLARENAPVARLLAGLQTQVRRPALLQLLQPGSVADAVHLRAVVVAVEPQIRARTAALRGELAQARALEGEAARLAAQRRTLQSELLARRDELAALSAAERLKARRASSAADREAERAFAIGENARDLSTLARRLEAEGPRPLGEVRAHPSLSGGARSPASGDIQAPHRLPVQGHLAAVQPSDRKGLTLETRPGALVIAPGPGRVAFVGPYRGYGTIVILEHAGGWTSLLTGLAMAQVAVGQTVVAGSPLGQAPTREPRVTIELRRDGIPVAPASQLR